MSILHFEWYARAHHDSSIGCPYIMTRLKMAIKTSHYLFSFLVRNVLFLHFNSVIYWEKSVLHDSFWWLADEHQLKVKCPLKWFKVALHPGFWWILNGLYLNNYIDNGRTLVLILAAKLCLRQKQFGGGKQTTNQDATIFLAIADWRKFLASLNFCERRIRTGIRPST